MKHLIFFFVGLYTSIVVHSLVLLSMLVAVPMLILYEPWYVSLPLLVWMLNLLTMPFRCPLTSVENYFRTKIGLPKINGFISKYVLRRGK